MNNIDKSKVKTNNTDWLNSEEYNALEVCCIKGGADVRALPYFIKSVQHQTLERIRGDMKKLKEKIIMLTCSKCGKKMKRIGRYQYYCPCNPSLGLMVI